MRTVSTPLPPGAARRRELRLQRRAERLRNLWRFLVFSSLAAGLGTVLLRQGWTLRDPSQLEVSGSALVSREQVIQAAEGLGVDVASRIEQEEHMLHDQRGAARVDPLRI